MIPNFVFIYDRALMAVIFLKICLNYYIQISMQTRWKRSLQSCGICYQKVVKRGKIDACNHIFCHQCIKNWSQIENTCPLCKTRFSKIEQKLTRKDYRQRQSIRNNPLQISEKSQSQTGQLFTFSIQDLTLGLFQIMEVDPDLLEVFLQAEGIRINLPARTRQH